MPKTYTFHISLPRSGRVWRKIEMLADQPLMDLHHAIQSAYGWDADHMYSFFMSGKAWDEASEYRLPEGYDHWGISDEYDDYEEYEEEDTELTPEEREAELREIFGDTMTLEEMEAEMDDFWEEYFTEEQERDSRNVQTTTIQSLNLKSGQTFMYLFDYGDEWRFKVRVHAINAQAPDDDYPKIVESVGEAPQQYPDWD